MQVAKIMNAVEQIITVLSNDFKEEMLLSKDEFLKSFGNIDEDSEQYENQTFLFHYWMLLNYSGGNMNINSWFLDQLVPTMKESFEAMNWSVFEYQGENFLKKIYIKDLLLSKKLLLINDNKEPFLFKGDLFIGRVVPWEDSFILLPGLLMLPLEVISKIKKQFKLIEKKSIKQLKSDKVDDLQAKITLAKIKVKANFLLNLSSKASRWNLYKKSDCNKIFDFQ